jgi:hypothetical protein
MHNETGQTFKGFYALWQLGQKEGFAVSKRHPENAHYCHVSVQAGNQVGAHDFHIFIHHARKWVGVLMQVKHVCCSSFPLLLYPIDYCSQLCKLGKNVGE